MRLPLFARKAYKLQLSVLERLLRRCKGNRKKIRPILSHRRPGALELREGFERQAAPALAKDNRPIETALTYNFGKILQCIPMSLKDSLASDRPGNTEIGLFSERTLRSSDMTTTTVPVGQTVTGVVINSGDEQDVYGTAIDTTDGGFQVVDGGTAADTTILQTKSFQLVDLGGTATGTTINYGSQQVNNGSTATDTTMKAGCYQWVFGTVTDTIMNGGVQYDYGTAIDTTDLGFQVVELGGTATGTAINNTGVVVVLGGGTAINTTINSFGQQVVSGTAIGTTINLYGYQAVGGTAYRHDHRRRLSERLWHGDEGTDHQRGRAVRLLQPQLPRHGDRHDHQRRRRSSRKRRHRN